MLPYVLVDNLQTVALVMDGKWVAYLVLAIMWVDTYGYPSIEKTYKAGVFFSIIYIAKAFYILATQHDLSRSGLLLEANYDGFMILIVYCFSSEVKNKKKWEDLILLFATFMTLSRTGFASLFAMWIIMAARKNLMWLVLLIPLLGGMAYLGVMMRGVDSAGHLDRFVYWNQAFIAFEHEDFENFVLGNIPGLPLKMPVLSEFMWTIDLFEEGRNVNGIFPFMFHSAYLRIAFTWGIPIAVLLIIYFIRKFFKAKYLPLKRLCIIILVQSFSLSTLTLPNVSLLLFMIYLLAINEDKIVRNINKKLAIKKVYTT